MEENYNVKGCVCKKQSGKGYYLSVWWFSGGEKFRKTVTLPSTIVKKSQAQQELKKYISNKQKELADCAGRHPFISLLSSINYDDFFKVKENTLYKYKQQINKFQNYLISYEESNQVTFYLESITYQDIQKFFQYELDFGSSSLSPLSLKTIKSYKNLLHKLFKKLYIVYDINKTNPVEQVDINDLQVTKRKQQNKRLYFTDEEILKFDNFLSNSDKYIKLAPIFKMCIICGLRRSEVLGLLWCNIDFDNNIFYIKHTRVRGVSKVLDEDSVKAEGSLRSFVLTPAILKIIHDQPFVSDHVFNDRQDKPWAPDYCSKLFKMALVDAGLPSNMSFKSTRSTCACKLLESNINDSQIIKYMGHMDIETTRRNYLENTKKTQTNLMNTIGGLFE